jgi:hypothetical protein
MGGAELSGESAARGRWVAWAVSGGGARARGSVGKMAWAGSGPTERGRRDFSFFFLYLFSIFFS